MLQRWRTKETKISEYVTSGKEYGTNSNCVTSGKEERETEGVGDMNERRSVMRGWIEELPAQRGTMVLRVMDPLSDRVSVPIYTQVTYLPTCLLTSMNRK